MFHVELTECGIDHRNSREDIFGIFNRSIKSKVCTDSNCRCTNRSNARLFGMFAHFVFQSLPQSNCVVNSPSCRNTKLFFDIRNCTESLPQCCQIKNTGINNDIFNAGLFNFWNQSPQ